MIRSATADDAGAIYDIYNHYVANTVVTFEETRLTIGEMRRRLDDVLSSHPFLVAEANGSVRGFSYASAWRARRLHTGIGIIALPNEGSTVLHERLGYVQVAELKHVGWKVERWIDVGYWQLML